MVVVVVVVLVVVVVVHLPPLAPLPSLPSLPSPSSPPIAPLAPLPSLPSPRSPPLVLLPSSPVPPLPSPSPRSLLALLSLSLLSPSRPPPRRRRATTTRNDDERPGGLILDRGLEDPRSSDLRSKIRGSSIEEVWLRGPRIPRASDRGSSLGRRSSIPAGSSILEPRIEDPRSSDLRGSEDLGSLEPRIEDGASTLMCASFRTGARGGRPLARRRLEKTLRPRRRLEKPCGLMCASFRTGA